MTRRILPLIVLLVAAVPAWTQAPAPASPVIVKVKAPALAILKSAATGEVHWVWDRRSTIPEQVYIDKANKTLVLGGPGVFFVSAVEFQTGKGFVQTDYHVTIEGGPLPPPGPGPDPPKPPPDGLAKQLKDAFKKDFDAGKAKQAEFRNVGIIFGEAGKFLGLATTTKDVLTLLSLALDTAVTDGHMPTVKGIVVAKLAAVAPKPVPLNDAVKDAFTKTFAELAAAIAEAQK